LKGEGIGEQEKQMNLFFVLFFFCLKYRFIMSTKIREERAYNLFGDKDPPIFLEIEMGHRK
jgi:hypothetical protein